MKKIVKKLSLLISALFLAGSLLYGMKLPAFAEETFQAAEESITQEQGHDSFSSEMLNAALSRYGLLKRSRLRNAAQDPLADSGKILPYASLPYTGKGYVVAFHVDFPDQPFSGDDTEAALQSAIGMDLAGKSYESQYQDQYSSIHDYYYRASYGKLSISGDAYTYHAKKNKADYTDNTELFKEVLEEMDDEVDFSRYDADEDGRIDCIYLHIPRDWDDGWGSTWWPNCSTLQYDELQYDGVWAASDIVISRWLDDMDEDGVRTIIHETGHAMGFPDYYSYDSTPDPAGGDNQLTGILTFDMMDSNIGDHNGFSKWIAGWLSESDVTRVVANEDGVSATRDGQQVGTVNEDGSVTLDLAGFDLDDPTKTGGIIVVGNDDGAPFSNYFLIQYDTFAGNQQVYYTGKDGAEIQLPSGFRVFRVQAELTDYGTLKHNNTDGPLYNKLIELVDPDYKDSHNTFSYPYIPNGVMQDPYSCMFYGGSLSLTPISAPSTNFREKIDVGFTGISIDFLETGGERGTLKISYSEDHKPVIEPLDVTLTEGVATPAGFMATLKVNRDIVFGAFGAGGISASVKDGEEFLDSDLMTDYSFIGDDTIRATFYFDTDILQKGKTVVVRCREGAFDLGTDEDSPPFEFEVPILPEIAELSESGYVEGTEEGHWGHALSMIQKDEDGSFFFYGYNGAFLPTDSMDIYKYRFTEDNPTEVTRELLASGSDERAAAVQFINSIYQNQQTEGASILPEGAELGEYPVVLDAAKIGDYYYVVSFLDWDYTSKVPDQMAVSKLDASGKLLEQVIPAGDDIPQNPETSSRVRILEGPNEKIAVLLFSPFQDRTEAYPQFLTGQMGTFFFDRDLNLEARLDNYSTGCGTWLPDGRFITFGQRNRSTQEADDAKFPRMDLVCYDITTAIDPPVIEYEAESADGEKVPEWEAGSSESLLFDVHRNIDDENCKKHFWKVQVDGTDLTKGKDYTAEFASVHITLLPDYLKTLSEGTHTLTVFFDDGEADVQFMIQKGSSPAPNTGDTSQPILWIILMAAALFIVVIVVVLLIRKQKK